MPRGKTFKAVQFNLYKRLYYLIIAFKRKIFIGRFAYR
jgi:hypothetical protein